MKNFTLGEVQELMMQSVREGLNMGICLGNSPEKDEDEQTDEIIEKCQDILAKFERHNF